MRVLAPAKINVYLRIVGRRPDGYHLLDSLMVPVSLYDEIMIAAGRGTPAITVTCDDPTLACDETNLAYRAAALLCREAGMKARVSIELHKRIPAGAGLGGGSSDAAAVLKSVNTLLALGLTDTQLCELATRLGADVPFFIFCRPAQVAGIGDVLTAVPALPRRWLLLVLPPFEISTPWAYRRFDELPRSEPLQASAGRKLAAPWHLGQWPPPDKLVNDLERAILPEYPRIAQIKDQLLRCGAEGVLMSGSGSATFGIFRSRAAAERAEEVLRQQGRTFLVTPLSGPPTST